MHAGLKRDCTFGEGLKFYVDTLARASARNTHLAGHRGSHACRLALHLHLNLQIGPTPWPVCAQVRDAVRRMFEGESAMDYDHTIAKDKQEAEEWLKELDVQIKRMNQVTAPS